MVLQCSYLVCGCISSRWPFSPTKYMAHQGKKLQHRMKKESLWRGVEPRSPAGGMSHDRRVY